MALALYIKNLEELDNCLGVLQKDFKEVIQVSENTPEFVMDDIDMENLHKLDKCADSFEYI